MPFQFYHVVNNFTNSRKQVVRNMQPYCSLFIFNLKDLFHRTTIDVQLTKEQQPKRRGEIPPPFQPAHS